MQPQPCDPELCRRICIAILLLAVGLVQSGCGPRPPRPREVYSGPTKSIGEVVSIINANNQRLQTLYLNHQFAAEIVERTKDGEPRRTKIDGGGVVMYQSPDNLFMNGRHPLGGKIFEIGANPQRYWLGVPHEKVDTIWWGEMRHLGKPCVADIPIRPDLLMEVLGVFTIDSNLARFPAPVMRFNHDEDAYMFTWILPQADRFIAVKEVWYDRQTMRPKRVKLFDAEGRVLVSAFLSQHRRVKIDDVPESEWPHVPGRYELFFTEDRSRMTIEVDDAYLRYKGAPDARVFRMPSPEQYANENQLDKGCTD
ncbi:MAG TPA: hypothetical protein VGR35_05910 [Tepidisphaeraceae bacterium]|nr:hypothetical protein [Tepidisphaeraceae bacterium]